jgi:hypothetical protein
VAVDQNDAECVTIDGLPDGNYFYTQESIDSNRGFETVLYYDNFEVGTTAMVDLVAFDPNNDFSDGVMVLGDTARVGEIQTLVIHNQLSSPTIPDGDNTLQICKVLFNDDGDMIAGSDGDATFEFTLTSELYPNYNRVVTIDTSLDLNTDLFTDIDGNDAECVTVSDLPDGSYFYTQESIDSDLEFEQALYFDDFEIGVNTMNDLIVFDGSAAVADGTIVLGDDGDAETQIIAVRNEISDAAIILGGGGGGSTLDPVGDNDDDDDNDNDDDNDDLGEGIVLGSSSDDDDDGLTQREIIDAILNAVPRGQVAGAQVAFVPTGAVAAGAGGAFSQGPEDKNLVTGAVTALTLLVLAGISIAVKRRNSTQS